MQEDVQVTSRRRPTGVTVIAIILFVVGGLGLLGAILGFAGSAILTGTNHGNLITTGTIVSLIIGAILAIGDIVAGWGLITLKPWAFWFTVIVQVLYIVNNLYNWLGAHSSIVLALIGMIIPVFILIYLFADRKIRPAFNV